MADDPNVIDVLHEEVKNKWPHWLSPAHPELMKPRIKAAMAKARARFESLPKEEQLKQLHWKK